MFHEEVACEMQGKTKTGGYMDRSSDNGLLTGLLVGTAIGIGLGLLYAPRTGAETREMLRERADEMRERAESMRASMRERVAMMRPMGGNGSGECGM
jgi:hypothetical protein